ncbi:hypothetical protein HCC70_08565 [Streptococcus suis]|uniref:ABC transporter permease n=1 Tax=Streptococcus suivaginalis TaxID=3028082 RepID=A0AA96VKA4_9STRE|nr:hypothetical protein [Streptococcus sp. 29896]MCK4028386.1 hypothetical protein [Streptococcus suis]WNY46499.1 hypothetical protein PXH68_06275 [Streptococcus sp. 29896]
MNLVKADWYRIRKEKLCLVSLGIVVMLSLILAYSSSKDLEVTGAQDILSNWTNLLPLFFVAPAKIFFGEDFQFRTVNNSLVRTQNRLKILTHKWLSSVGLCVFYVLFAYMLTGFARQMMNGAADYGVLLEGFVYQLPFYIVIASFCTILFVVFPKIYQVYMVYILIAFLFDQLFMMATGILLKTDFFADFMMFSQLSVAAGTKNLLSLPSILAFVFSVVYVSCGALLFSKKELK